MIQYAVTILTAAIMLGHSVFGCCWHHEHAIEDEYASVNQPAIHSHVVVEGCTHNNHSTDENDSELSESLIEEHGDQHHHPPCHEELCKYVLPVIVQLSDTSQELLFDAPFGKDSHGTPFLSQIRSLQRFDASASGYPASLRAQTLTQAWLL